MKYTTTVASLLLAASLSHAATITWGSATTISTSTDVSTTGTSVYATYFSGNAESVTAPLTTVVNGITFAKQSTFAGNGNITVTTGTFNTGFFTSSVTDADYQRILNSPLFSTNTATLTGLTNGQQYQVQVWAQDPRYNNATTTNISGGPSLRIDSNFTSNTAGFGQFAIGTFTADAITQNIVFGNLDNGIVNAIQVRAIPEPSSAILGGLPLLALLRRRR